MKNFVIEFLLILGFLTLNFTAKSQVNLSDGLLAYLPMDGDGQDLSGNNNHASSVGNQTFWGVDQNLLFPGSMRFIGNNGQAKMTFGTPLLNNLNEYSISFNILMSIPPATNEMSIFGQDNLLEIVFFESPNRFVVYHPNGTANITITPNPTIFQVWRKVLVTGNSTELNVYVDGVLEQTLSGDFTLGSTTTNTNIGGHVINQLSSSWLRGQLDDLRIYTRVLTTDEINALSIENYPNITIDNISATTFCAGDDLTVDFSLSNDIQAGNSYFLQLSDETGDFENQVTLAKIESSNLTETFNTEIPTGTPSGTSYKLRVVSSNMPGVSAESNAITINGVVGDIPNSSYVFIGNVGGKNYYRRTTSSGGGTAQNNSQSSGGNLATVYDSTTNALFYYTASHMGARHYIGLNDISSEGTYEWRNNVALSYMNWDSNQPDNAGNEDYTEITGDDGRWNDVSNTKSNPHIMELSPAGSNTSFCLGNDIQFDAFTLSGATYSWSGPNGFTSTLQNPLISNGQNLNAGTYTVTYTLGACSVSENIEVTMNQLPSISSVEVFQDSICSGEDALIIVTNSDPTISYQLKDAVSNTNIGTVQVGNNDTLFFNTGALATTSDFNFQVTFTSTGCESITSNVTVHVRNLPSAPTTTNDEVCNSGQMTITASGAQPGENYNWYLQAVGGDPIVGQTGNNLTINTNNTINYYISILDVHGCESARTTATATVINPLSPPVDIVSGLILHYKFDGDYQDYSGNDYDATPSGNITFVNDKNSNPTSAINSISVPTPGNNFINAGNPAKIQQLTNQVTISMWIRQTQTWFQGMPLLNKWDNTGMFIGLGATAANNKVRWRINSSTYVQSNTNVPMQEWHHIVCTYNGSQLKVYQNGVLTGTTNTSGNIPNTWGVDLLIGRQANYAGGIPDECTYRGDMDEIKMYDRALNSEEIQTLYNDESVAFASTPLCDGQDDLTLTTFNFPGATYHWTGPNGFSSTQQNPTLISNADSTTYAGTYTLEVTNSTGCTSLPQNVEIVIHEIPVVSSVVNDTVCGSGDAVLSAVASPSDATFLWYTSDTGGSPIPGESAENHTVNNLTDTVVRYVSAVKYGCESSRTPVTAIYNSAVNTSLNVSGNTVCANEINTTIDVQATETGINYQAYFGGNPVSNIVSGGGDITLSVDLSTLSVGNNTISISATQNGCGSVNLDNTATIIVNTLPLVNAGVDQAICSGETIVLSGSGADSYSWDNGVIDGVSFSPTSTTTYTVTGTDANGCQNTDQVQVTVDTPPVVTANASQSEICSGQSVVLSGSGANSYMWDNGVVDGVSFSPTNTATYTVTGTLGACESTSQTTITVHASPTLTINASQTEICSGETVVLSASGADSYSWDNGVIDGVSFSPTSTTTYTVTGTDANGCQNTGQIQVIVNPLPTVTLDAFEILCINDADVVLTQGNPSGGDYSGQGIVNNSFSPATVGIGTFPITYTYVDVNGCENSATNSIQVDGCASIASEDLDKLQIFPNPFKNTFQIKCNGRFSYEIRDTKGRLLTSGSNMDQEKVDLHQYSDGIYIVQVTNNGVQLQLKVIKM